MKSSKRPSAKQDKGFNLSQYTLPAAPKYTYTGVGSKQWMELQKAKEAKQSKKQKRQPGVASPQAQAEYVKNHPQSLNQTKQSKSKGRNWFARMFSSEHLKPTFLTRKLLPDSQSEGLQAVMEHKKKYNINDPYLFIDKRSSQYYVINNGNNVVKLGSVTLGRHKGDGYYDYFNDPATINMRNQQGQFYWTMPNTTPAGVFTVKASPTSRYQGNAPMYILLQSGVQIPVALHSPADNSYERNAYLNGNSKVSNRVSYGCISGKCSDLNDMYNNSLITTSDSVYVNPEIEGNKLIEKNGKIQMEWGGNNPQYFTSDGGWKAKFTYNNAK